ncbi:hypothetical protein [Psychrobacter sp. 16-MNA-CIBAN-0192]|uniref:hypothetical protein n=1 Tax=Psychrobacter sp. 16-MNA-CIBAN-0192 TaxID=3140448 RepID=UPI0033201AA1
MNLVKVSDLFDVKYGVNLDLNKLDQVDRSHPDAIRYVGRSSRNNGVTAFVKRVSEIDPNPRMTISVAGGGSVMCSFAHDSEYYSGRDLFYLLPKSPMTIKQLLFYCTALTANKFKFSYGRQANRTLSDLLIPDIYSMPPYINSISFKDNDGILENIDQSSKLGARLIALDTENTLTNLFKVYNGVSSNNVVVQPTRSTSDLIPYIRPSKWQSSSYGGFVDKNLVPKDKIYPEETLYISTNGAGSHTYAYVSVESFLPNSDVAVLIPKRQMCLNEKLVYATFITSNRFKFSYGRKPKGLKIKNMILPMT